MPSEYPEETYNLIFTALKHPVRRRILRMLDEKPMTFTEILNSLSVSTGHLNFYLESLGELISKGEDGKYRLSTLGVAALNLLRGVEEPASKKRKRNAPYVKIIYSMIMCLLLLISASYTLMYHERNVSFRYSYMPVNPHPIRIRPKESVTIDYTITYNGTGTAHWSQYSLYAHLDLYPPSNAPEYREWDLASFQIDILGRGVYYQMELYTPSGGLERFYNFTPSSGGSSMSWRVKEPGTYRIIIMNINSTGVMEIKAYFSFIRWYERKPLLYLGYTLLSAGLGFPLILLAEALYKIIKMS